MNKNSIKIEKKKTCQKATKNNHRNFFKKITTSQALKSMNVDVLLAMVCFYTTIKVLSILYGLFSLVSNGEVYKSGKSDGKSWTKQT